MQECNVIHINYLMVFVIHGVSLRDRLGHDRTVVGLTTTY